MTCPVIVQSNGKTIEVQDCGKRVTVNLSGIASASADLTGESFIVVSASANLTSERVLTGTANQVVVTDGGAGGNVTLSTPQDLHSGASVTFAGATLSGLTASRLMASDGSKGLASVADLTAWLTGTANQIGVANDGDGSATVSLVSDPVLPGEGAVTVPDGTTAQRPGTPAVGMLRYNTTSGEFEGFDGVWGSIGGSGGTPGGSDTQVQFNDSSAFGGDAGLVYNKTTDTLTGVNLIVSTSLQLFAGTPFTSLATGSADNDTIPTKGYVDDNAGGMSIGGTVTSGTTGSILFVGSGPVLAQDNAGLFFDPATDRLGIGTATPGGIISALHSVNGITPALSIQNASSGSSAQTRIDMYSNTGSTAGTRGFSIFLTSSTYASPFTNAAGFYLYENGPFIIGTNASEKLRVTATGDVGIGTGTVGARLHVSHSTANSARVRVSETGDTTDAHYCGFELRDGATLKGALLKSGSSNDVSIWNASEAVIVVTQGSFVGIGVTPSTRLDIDAGALETAEMTAPGAPAANGSRLFTRDDGAGVTQTCLRFATGDILVIGQQGVTVPTYTPTNDTTDRAFDADTVLVAELADVVSTLIRDLGARGLITVA